MEEIEAINTEAMKSAAIKKELDDKIRVWEKNRNALLDLAGLLYILKTDTKSSVSGAALFYRVLNNLKDPEITIAWKGKSLHEEYCKLHKEIDSMAEEYSKLIPEGKSYFARLRSMNIDEYMFESHILDEHGDPRQWYDQPYDLMVSLATSVKIKWTRELLTSNIPNVCVEMLDCIISNTTLAFTTLVEDSYYPDSVYPEVWNFGDGEEEKKKSIEGIYDLFKLWERVMLPSRDHKYRMMREIPFANLKFLQENGIIDFTRDLKFYSDYGYVAAPVQIYCRDRNGIYYFGSFYDTESYRELSEEIRQNTDKFLIHNIVRVECHELDRLIQLQNFKVTDENVREIISAVSSNYDKAQYSINKICEAIEKKSKTPKEYRKAKQYIGQIRDALDPEKLKQQRHELVRRLMNMNDSLQEQVPGKMKIKDIPFRVENK